jgi:hypothetical protein
MLRTKYVLAAVVLVALLIGYGYIRVRRGFGGDFASAGLAAALNLRVGDRVPSQGRIISSIPVSGSKAITPDAPIGLYPGAIIQGIALYPSTKGYRAQILLGTDDPEESVLQYYLNVWSGLNVHRLEPIQSILYEHVAPDVTQQWFAVRTGRNDDPIVFVQRGPAIQPMEGAQFAEELHGKIPLPLQPGGAAMTEIWLNIPVR